MNRNNERLSDRAISVEWQRILEQRGMKWADACASLEHGGTGRVLRLRNAGKSVDIPMTLMQLEMPLEQFTASILAPAVGTLS